VNFSQAARVMAHEYLSQALMIFVTTCAIQGPFPKNQDHFDE